MKMKLMNKKYLQQKFSWKVLVPQTTADFMSMGQQELCPLIPYGNAFSADSSKALQAKNYFFMILVTTKLF